MKTSEVASKISIPLLITTLAIFLFPGASCAGERDKVDHLSQQGSPIFSPGYINAAKQKTEAIMHQTAKTEKKGVLETVAKFVGDIVLGEQPDSLKEDAAPDLQKKNSATNENVPNASSGTIESSAEMNIEIGSGESKTYDDSGRLLSEVIQGQRYVYVGFDNAGKATLQEGIDIAQAGDSVIVKAGLYTIPWLLLKNGVNFYGGYSEDGTRDLENTPSIIHGSVQGVDMDLATEINGFNIFAATNEFGPALGDMEIYNCTNLRVVNTTFIDGFGMGVYMGSNVTSINNNFLNELDAIYAGDGSSVSSLNDYFQRENMVTSFDVATITVTNPSGQQNTQLYNPNPTQVTDNSQDSSQGPLITLTDYRFGEVNATTGILLTSEVAKLSDDAALGNLFKGLLKSKQNLAQTPAEGTDKTLTEKLNDGTLGYAVALSPGVAGPENTREAEALMILSNIIKNPTDEQRALLDTIEALIAESEQAQAETDATGLKKTTDDLIQAVASALLAQAIPDLLKENDILNIKNIFSELETTRKVIVLEYQEAVKPYYREVIKELSKNLAILQIRGILSSTITDDELRNMSPAEINKILDKLKAAKDKIFEEEYLLQQEAKYRKQYIDPNRKIFETRMKDAIQGFSKRLYDALEGAHTVKAKTVTEVTATPSGKNRK